jgi:hypothetical protein
VDTPTNRGGGSRLPPLSQGWLATTLSPLGKLELAPVGNDNNVEDMAFILGCRVSSLHMKYLGLPMRTSYKAKSIWDSIIEKIDRCLVGCKRLYFYKGDMITLIKNTLSNLPTYFVSFSTPF